MGLLAGFLLCLFSERFPFPSLRWQPPGPLERGCRGLHRAAVFPAVPTVAPQPDSESRAESGLTGQRPHQETRAMGTIYPGHEGSLEERTSEVPQGCGKAPDRAPESTGRTRGGTSCPPARIPRPVGPSPKYSGDRSAVRFFDGCLDARRRWVRSDSCPAESILGCLPWDGQFDTGAASWACPSCDWCHDACCTRRDSLRPCWWPPDWVASACAQDPCLYGEFAGLTVLWCGGRSLHGSCSSRPISTVARKQLLEEPACFNLARRRPVSALIQAQQRQLPH